MARHLTRGDVILGVVVGNLLTGVLLAGLGILFLLAVSSGFMGAFFEGFNKELGIESALPVQSSRSEVAAEVKALTRKLERDLAQVEASRSSVPREETPSARKVSTTCEAAGVVGNELRVRGLLKNDGYASVGMVILNLELLDSAGEVVSAKEHMIGGSVAPGRSETWVSTIPLPEDRSDERVECRVSPFQN